MNNDKTEELKLNWTVREYIGCEIIKKGSEEPLKQLDDIKIGDEILLPLFNGYCEGKVVELSGKNGYARSVNDVYGTVLEFGGDDRECWVSVGLINLRGIKKLTKGLTIE
jgi:hypothetical protein